MFDIALAVTEHWQTKLTAMALSTNKYSAQHYCVHNEKLWNEERDLITHNVFLKTKAVQVKKKKKFVPVITIHLIISSLHI